MLDNTSPITTMNTTTWRAKVSYGDILSFRFPLAEEAAAERPKARPCLILDVVMRGDRRYVLLAYGTTSRRPSNVGHEIHVRRQAAYSAAGLDRPTRFVGARRLLVPLTHSGFVVRSDTDSAVIGRLSGQALGDMNAVRARIFAARDIAEHYRSNDRRRRSPRTTVTQVSQSHPSTDAGDKGVRA